MEITPYDRAVKKYGHLKGQQVNISPIQGYRTAELVEIFPVTVGRGDVVYVLSLPNKMIVRFLDAFDITEISKEVIPMTDDVNDNNMLEGLTAEPLAVVPTTDADDSPTIPVVKAPPKAKPAKSLCVCGCGGMTGGAFVPGHDAKVKSQLGKVLAGKESVSGVADTVLDYIRNNPKWNGWFSPVLTLAPLPEQQELPADSTI